MPGEEFLVFGRCYDQHALSMPEAFPEVEPYIFGERYFVSLIELYKVTPGVGSFEKLFPGRHLPI
jgi:hypothetical protein